VTTPLLERRQERILRRLEELRAWRNAREFAIVDWTFTASDGAPRPVHLKDFWPVIETPINLKATARIPREWTGQPVELELWLGGEARINLSTGLQAGLNPMHHRWPLVERAVGGEEITIDAEVVPKGIFGGNIPEPRLERAHFVIPHREARDYERDLTMLLDATVELIDHEVTPFLLDVAERSLSELADGWESNTDVMVSRYVLGYDSGLGSGTQAVPNNWVPQAIDARRPTSPTWSLPPAPRALEPMSEEAVAAIKRARAVYAAGIQDVLKSYPPVGQLVLTGHAHIDLAWLWPVAETRRKIRRTFSTVLDLMDRYPDFTFNQSSAQAYSWIEQDDPAVFAKIKERVKEGRWDPVGGMWLESDCNVTGGEAFVRQLFYGQQYFLKTFGRRHDAAWLPDVFGFSAGIPQLLRGANLTGFFTIKLNWNEENRFPYDLFQWEGLDGSRVNANLFFNPGEGYNGNIVPLDTLGTWREHRGKTIYPKSLLAFGWGDGAGGPTEKMLENYERIKEFPALPRLGMGAVDEFFAGIPDTGLPRWVGELYLELHRGTLTSQAKTKELNRASEHRLLEAEAFSALSALTGAAYPRAEIDQTWKILLLNQFHDILPGSSIKEVYEVTERELAGVVAKASEIRDAALAMLGGNGAASSDRALVANAGINDRPLQLFLPAQSNASVSGPDGNPLPTQAAGDGLLVGGARVPGLGWTTLTIGAANSAAPAGGAPAAVTATAVNGGATIENALLLVEIGADGSVTRIFDKQAGCEALAGRANQLWAYVDKPRSWDAWDIDETYERDGEEIVAVTLIVLTETGPLRASVRVERHWRNSTITQTYRLWTESRRLDVDTKIEWHQRQVLVKALFPLNVRSDHAVFETMYGVVSRATHRNTTWDQARFEGSAHRFADVSETGYGVAVLNNSKYAYGIHDNVLNLSLLRSPMYPDALADEGTHVFTYSIFPHVGAWTDAGVTAEAFALNSPLTVVPAGSLAGAASFVSASGLEIGLGSLKLAESGEGAILRIYEPHGARGVAALAFDRPVKSVRRVNLLEEPQEGASPVTSGGKAVTLELRPFEVVSLQLTF